MQLLLATASKSHSSASDYIANIRRMWSILVHRTFFLRDRYALTRPWDPSSFLLLDEFSLHDSCGGDSTDIPSCVCKSYPTTLSSSLFWGGYYYLCCFALSITNCVLRAKPTTLLLGLSSP